MNKLNNALEGARRFIEPLTDANQANGHLRVGSVLQAQQILSRLHPLLEDERIEKISAGEALDVYDNFRVTTVSILLEFIAIWGLLPCLPPEAAEVKKLKYIPQPVRDNHAKQSSSSRQQISRVIAMPLVVIATETGKGIEPILRDNVLPIITCAAAIAIDPSAKSAAPVESPFQTFHDFADRLPMVILLPLLTSLVRSIKDPNLHGLFATELAVLPLRDHGVQHIIEFIASSLVPPSAVKESHGDLQSQDQEIPMSLEALQQASRLLSSVPESLDTHEYFESVAPQLLSLLDGTCGTTMATAAAYIIGTGILGKRSTGAPGTVGWELLAKPLIETINPELNQQSGQPLAPRAPGRIPLGKVLVSSTQLDLALRRLSKIILSHPNPGLTKRLLRSLILPLWGLTSSKEEPSADRSTPSTAWDLLETYIRLYASAEQISDVAKNLLFDGPPEWILVVGDDGHFGIQPRDESQQGTSKLLDQMTDLDRRTNLFVKLLSDCDLQNHVLCAVFSNTVKDWLSSQKAIDSASSSALRVPERFLFRPLIGLRLATEMVTHFQDNLASQTLEVVRIVGWLLAEVAQSFDNDTNSDQVTASLTLAQLGEISQAAVRDSQANVSKQPSSESLTIAAISISLLDTALQTPDADLVPGAKQHLESIKASIKIIGQRSRDLPLSLMTSMTSVESRMDTILHGKDSVDPSIERTEKIPSKGPEAALDRLDEDRQVYRVAMAKFSSQQPPVRVEGLSSLSALINASSPAVDVPATTVMLLTMLSEDDPMRIKTRSVRSPDQSDPEEADPYVVLATLSTLTQLAKYEPRIVIPLLLDTYLDRSTSHSLDARLRIAEALGSTVDAFFSQRTPESVPQTIREHFIVQIAEAALILSSRRSRNIPNAQPANTSTSPPQPPPPLADEEHTLPTPPPPNNHDETLHHILSSWSLTPHNEEDLRLRASALSLLSRLLSSSSSSILPLLGTTPLLSTIVDTACAVLRFERGPENAIARRAAAVLLVAFVRAVAGVWEDEGEEGLMRAGRGGDVEQMVEKVGVLVESVASGVGEEDELVRGHLGVLMEELDAWKVRRVVGIEEARGPEGAGMTGELRLKRLRGLGVDVEKEVWESGEERRLIEEVED